MKKKKILEMYYDFVENGIPLANGLCKHFEHDYSDLWELMAPNGEERLVLMGNGFCATWWSSEQALGQTTCFNQGVMTPLRQNIVLLMAVMAGEL